MRVSVDAMEIFTRRPSLIPLGLALLAQTLFSWRLTTPHQIVFDEIHYVGAARKLLELSGPANLEHPLFGKTLIALGMGIFGDNPLGWRAMSTLAGTATLLAIYAIAVLLTGRRRAGVIAALLALFGQTLFVQARIAMLDTFMAALLAGALATLLWALKSERHPWPKWIGGSVLMGLAIGTKWAAVPYLAIIGAGVLALRWWRREPLVLPVIPAGLVLGGIAFVTYLLTFLPAFFYASEPMTLARLLPFQLEMYRLQTQVLPSHTYQSDWWSWPILYRPIWYLYEVADGAQRGILLVANPVVAWGGLVAVTACLWLGWRRRSLGLIAPAALWAMSLAVFAIIPKSLGFFYYYYPSTLWLAVAIAVAFDATDPAAERRWDEWFVTATIAVFVFFWPIISAAALNSADAFDKWTLFSSWV